MGGGEELGTTTVYISCLASLVTPSVVVHEASGLQGREHSCRDNGE